MSMFSKNKRKVAKGIFTRLDGCPIVNNVCVDCLPCEELVGVTHRRRKKKEGEVEEYMFHHCLTPFTHFPMMFSSLSYPLTFQGLPSLYSPTNLSPLEKVMVP